MLRSRKKSEHGFTRYVSTLLTEEISNRLKECEDMDRYKDQPVVYKLYDDLVKIAKDDLITYKIHLK